MGDLAFGVREGVSADVLSCEEGSASGTDISHSISFQPRLELLELARFRCICVCESVRGVLRLVA